MLTISNDEIKDILYAKILYNIHIAKDKIDFFQAKYKCDFLSFEGKVKTSSKESYSEWDDYMEWKSYNNFLTELNSQKSDLENGNIKVA